MKQIQKAEIVMSAVSQKQYPKDQLPEIAVAGRSNVGKSSFINSLLSRKGLARTSSKPGKTRTINFFLIDEKFYLVDVPGYGYAKVSKQERNKWGQMMDEYFTQRESLQLTVLLVDARHDPSELDIQMYEFLKHYGLPVLVVATKCDKIKPSKRPRHLKAVKEGLNLEPGDEVVLYSSEKLDGRNEVWKYVNDHL
ncbi:MAG: ribosome biogenesis GTP-binding protein YihA/YsxC [Atopococcus tabaci]|uniref:Probable GTP-binding protein EngB n=1 Tax=Atopococcus tabaci TaxID=269774 RepID=A0AA43RJP1_9LACT|nr:ribosome biogenesis GTP-binding protein YihA/YsxC [Atopococcus tabaci]